MRRITRLLASWPLAFKPARALTVLCVSAFMVFPTAVADAEVPPARAAAIVLSSLAHDRNLSTRAGSRIDVAVVYAAGDKDSRSEMEDIVAAIETVSVKGIKGLDVKVIAHEYASKAKIEELAGDGVDALYICRGVGEHAGTIASVAKSKSILTITGKTSYLSKGLCMGVGMENRKPQLLVNSAACGDAGVDFSAKLLRLAKTVD